MEIKKLCKYCERSEPEVSFNSRSKVMCKSCQSVRQSLRVALKNDREYKPITEANKTTLKILLSKGLVKNKPSEIKEGFKKCTKCNQILSIDNFYILGDKNKNGTDKIYSRCKECERSIVLNHPKREKYVKASNSKKKERIQEDPEYREYVNNINRKYTQRENGIITTLLQRAKKRAEENNLEFNLTREDIILPTHCPILKTKMVKGTKENYDMTYSIDRVDNSKGYVKSNVKIISMLANTMKNSASLEQLQAFVDNIMDYTKNTNKKDN